MASTPSFLRNSAFAILLCALSSIALSGCISPEQQREQQALKREQREHDRQVHLEQVRGHCQEFGFQVGTDNFAQCVQDEVQRDQSRAAADADRKRKAADVNLCKSAMYARPTRTGSLAESAANAAKCDSDPQAHLHEESQRSPSYTCKKNINGSVDCDPR